MFIPIFTGRRKTGFNPSQLSNLSLWLDPTFGLFQEITGAVATTPASTDTNPVGTWLAKTGQYLTAPTTAKRPILKTAIRNGVNGIRFDGVDDGFTVPLVTVQNHTGFVVASRTVANTGGSFYGGAANSPQYRLSSSIHQLWSFSMFDGPNANTTLAADTFYMLGYTYNSATVAYRANNAADGSGAMTSTLSAGINSLGAANGVVNDFWGGDICEVLIYSRVLDATEIGKVEGYLKNKYGF